VKDWFAAKDQRLIVFTLDAKGGFEPSFQFPSKLKSKGAYFLKPHDDMAINKDNVKVSLGTCADHSTCPLSYATVYCQTLIRGDLSYNPVEQMQALVDGVFVPVLSNNKNTDQWPAVVSADVASHAKVASYKCSMQPAALTALPLVVRLCKRLPKFSVAA